MNIDIEIVCKIAKAAGEAIMRIYGEDDFAIEMKADNSPLTAADKASHEVIVAGLQKYWPDIPILSEEGEDIPYEERKNWQRFWLVDPIDGTKEFIKRNGEFTVNIALIEGQSPVAGVVYVPAQEKLYWGEVAKGAWLQQGTDEPKPIRVRKPDLEKGLTVVMSRSHPSPELEAYLKTLKVADAVSVGSSLKLCVVAEGKADLYPRLGPTMEWDTAAGQSVVECAGGMVYTAEGMPLRYGKESLLNPFFIVSGK
ncbi:MAG: 3'(2'),5'-bisphosphate nucleotidase CysQ [Spirochaetales bacterium]|jgi:3'(2'), 5'-bisphosphate nucleotidase|nr:3'(2'),5'-bisphosphate nucleotidase CysQ [Spirochaetales bacterium]